MAIHRPAVRRPALACASLVLPPPRSTPFPYTTLFRSLALQRAQSWRSFPTQARCRSPCRAPRQWHSPSGNATWRRSEEHTSELQSPCNLVCRLLLEKKKRSHAALDTPLPPTTSLTHTAHPARAHYGYPPPSCPSPGACLCFARPSSTAVYTLSLHDALPISSATASAIVAKFPHPIQVPITMPSTSPMAQPVRQCNVA